MYPAMTLQSSAARTGRFAANPRFVTVHLLTRWAVPSATLPQPPRERFTDLPQGQTPRNLSDASARMQKEKREMTPQLQPPVLREAAIEAIFCALHRQIRSTLKPHCKDGVFFPRPAYALSTPSPSHPQRNITLILRDYPQVGQTQNFTFTTPEPAPTAAEITAATSRIGWRFLGFV